MKFRRDEWRVGNLDFRVAKPMVERLHYARGGSNTFVYCHGLFRRESDEPVGVAWWLPPTRVACESVNREHWRQVLALTRMVVEPDVPKNAASFLLSRSVKMIRQDGRFKSLVTYADESQNHSGGVYRAANWDYVGRTGPYTRWIDPLTGRQVSAKATVNRTKAQMESLGFIKDGSFYKHKFVLHLPAAQRRFPLLEWLLAA